jgi:aspartate dehydrogenase
MRIGMIGGGTIAALFLEHIKRGDLGAAEVVAIAGRADSARGKALARAYGIAYVTDIDALLAQRPQIVVEAAAHQALHEYAERLLTAGIGVIVLSAGAMADDDLRERLIAASHKTGALLYVPSGGIGGLDALKGAMMAGVDAASITSSKPPQAWKGIAYVEALQIDLDGLREPRVLYDGPARAGVGHFPQNVNIAAVLSMAGIGFDRTRLKAVAVPGLERNTHTIEVRGRSGEFRITLENVPAPGNPKTAWLACYSALAALKQVQSPVRFGT